MTNRGGPPPVRQRQEPEVSLAVQNLTTIQDTMRADGGAEARAIRAMFGGDQDLMNRFLAVVFSSIANNRDILECNPMSVVQAIKDAAALGLEPTGLTGEGAIIPYKGIATFQPMWRGYVKRIRNSGKVVDIDCQIVYEGDDFQMALGTNPTISHRPVLPGEGERGSYRGCYAWAQMPSGLFIIEWMTTPDINSVRDNFSPSVKGGKSSPWDTSWSEMARKTVIKRLAKRLPGSAVDDLLRVEAKGDRLAQELKAEQERLRNDQNDVRVMALRAVGMLPSGEPVPTQGEPSDPEAPEVKDGATTAEAAAPGTV